MYHERDTMMEQRRARILIVDDEPVNIQVLSAALQREYDLETAASGNEAISRIKQSPPDLILLDVMMPGMSGFEVCRLLKAEEPYAHIPVIFLTAMDSFEGESEGLKAGGIDYITKPIKVDLVRLRVSNHVELIRRNELIREQRDVLAIQKAELEASLARIRRLEGIIPICMYCKKIRNDNESWQQLEKYISDHSEAMFSHSICPTCFDNEARKLGLR